jgi:hypothetical protein
MNREKEINTQGSSQNQFSFRAGYAGTFGAMKRNILFIPLRKICNYKNNTLDKMLFAWARYPPPNKFTWTIKGYRLQISILSSHPGSSGYSSL